GTMVHVTQGVRTVAFRAATVIVALAAAAVLSSDPVLAQGAKRPLDHEVHDIWKSIQGRAISDDGRWVLYSLSAQQGDAELHVHDLGSPTVHTIERGTAARFTGDSRHVVFTIRPRRSAVEEARRARARPADQPKDSLGFLDLATGEVAKVARVRSFAVPESGGGWAAYLLEADPADSRPAADSAGGARAAGGTAAEGRRERRKEDGTTLVLRNLATGDEHRFERVASYRFSEDGLRLVYAASSRDGESDGVFVVDVASGRSTPVLTRPGVYTPLAFDRSGDQLAFITDRDDHDADHPTFTLYHWRAGQAEARPVARTGSRGLPAGWVVSEHAELRFSDSGRRLFFGTSPRPIPDPDPDTLPPE